MQVSFTGTKAYVAMMELLRDIYQHEETSDTLRTFIRLRIKQYVVRDDLELKDFLDGRE